MGQECLGDVKRQATEEDCKHECPFEVLVERIEERTLANTISHDCKGDVSETIEDDDDTEPHLPGVNIVLLQVTIEPTDGEVVCGRHDPRCTNSIVGANVGDNGNLGRETNVAKQELPEQWCEGSTDRPESDGVEEQFVTAIGVLLPTCKFIIDSQGYSLFETLACPSSKTNNIAINLET